MSALESPTSTGAVAEAGARAQPPRKRTPQVGLSTLLLATACIAAWGSTWLNRQRIDRLQAGVTTMRSLARELVITDRDHLAIVEQVPKLFDEHIWHVFVPDDARALHLVTRGIPPLPHQSPEQMEGPAATTRLPAGRHVIELRSALEDDQWLTKVFVDGEPVITVRESQEWNAGRGSTGGAQFSTQADLPPGEPAVLFSRIFMLAKGEMDSALPTGPSNGIVLWIAEAPEGQNQPPHGQPAEPKP